MASLDHVLDRLAALGARGAEANSARQLEERRRADAELDQLLARLAHPATAPAPVEAAAADRRVA